MFKRFRKMDSDLDEAQRILEGRPKDINKKGELVLPYNYFYDVPWMKGIHSLRCGWCGEVVQRTVNELCEDCAKSNARVKVGLINRLKSRKVTARCVFCSQRFTKEEYFKGFYKVHARGKMHFRCYEQDGGDRHRKYIEDHYDSNA